MQIQGPGEQQIARLPNMTIPLFDHKALAAILLALLALQYRAVSKPWHRKSKFCPGSKTRQPFCAASHLPGLQASRTVAFPPCRFCAVNSLNMMLY